MQRALTIGILCFWFGMMSILVRRTWLPTFGSQSGLPNSAVPVPDGTVGAAATGEEWLGVYQEAHKIGYVQQSTTPADDGLTFTQTSVLHLKVMDVPQMVRTTIRGRVSRDLALRTFDFELSSGAGTLRASGTVDGTTLHLVVHTGAEVSERDVALSEPIYLASILRQRLGTSQLQPGRHLEALVFDPTVLGNERMTVHVEEEEAVPQAPPGVTGWRIREEYRGMRTTAWIDAHGTVLREEGPMGLTLVRETAAQARNGNWDDATLVDVVAAASVPVAEPIVDPRTRATLRLRLFGVSPDRVPSDSHQIWDGEMLVIRRADLRSVRSYPLPYRGEDLKQFLQPSPFLQSDHPRLQALAREILGAVVDAREAAGRLNDWVYGNLRKAPTMSLPNALQVLDMGEGDCNEHAVLLAALGRAVGLPTRVVAGTVYLDGAFLYHAWCEVWVGEWVPIDPALHQWPADATHLKFVAGDPQDQVGMMRIIGRLRIEVAPNEPSTGDRAAAMLP